MSTSGLMRAIIAGTRASSRSNIFFDRATYVSGVSFMLPSPCGRDKNHASAAMDRVFYPGADGSTT
ncbi:MAG: hypothetical protein GYA24_06665 [Candidatus Lokiarchaeota archaeon]|nr:hypothetical protein [Candidatus Lokiarchaeota archaeon]